MSHELDLRGIKEPFGYVCAHLLLVQLAPGTHVQMMLDDGDPAVFIPKDLADDGHVIHSVERHGVSWRVDVARGTPSRAQGPTAPACRRSHPDATGT